MVPPEGFDLPISRIEEGADAGRGNARTQPRARDCRVAPSRFADADFRETTPENRKERRDAFPRRRRFRGARRRSNATRRWYRKRFRTRLCSDARAPAGLSRRGFRSRRSRLPPAPNARALPTDERPYERHLTCRCSAGSPPSSPRKCCSSRLGCSRRASRRRCTSQLCTRTSRRCPVVRGGSHGRGCSRREVSQEARGVRSRVAGFLSMVVFHVPTPKNDVSLFRDDGDENAPSCPRPGGRRTG